MNNPIQSKLNTKLSIKKLTNNSSQTCETRRCSSATIPSVSIVRVVSRGVTWRIVTWRIVTWWSVTRWSVMWWTMTNKIIVTTTCLQQLNIQKVQSINRRRQSFFLWNNIIIHPPHSVYPKDCTNPHCTFYPSATLRTSISPSSAPSSPDYADLQPSSPMFQSHNLCQHTLGTSSVYLSLYKIWYAR